MSYFRNWPTDFDNPRAATNEFDRALIGIFDEIIATGGRVYEDGCLFGFSRDNRMIDFVRRGGGFWEVWPQESGAMKHLGPLFGLRESACIVARRIDDVRELAIRWLNGLVVESVIDGITFWDRTHPEQSLQRMA